ITNAQRLKRPSSPHFTIYQPQLTWVASIAHRGTGIGLSVALYTFAIGYLASPVIGIPLDSATLVEFVHSLPEWFKFSAKAIFAYPFMFHCFNGVRHLVWDTGYFLSVKGAYTTGYTVLGLTAL
ncbi:cytochrome b560 subunit of succinate dehydrogenase, partial [Calocera cornea HHB12733]